METELLGFLGWTIAVAILARLFAMVCFWASGVRRTRVNLNVVRDFMSRD